MTKYSSARSLLPLAGIKQLRAPYFRDSRGAFCQMFQASDAGNETDVTFMQDNFSISEAKGVLRGLHFQRPPFAQAKLIQVLRGKIFDVALDIRPQSPTFGQHFALTMEADGGQLFIPVGYAHGFMTLQDETMVYYKVSQPYAADCEAGIHWADPDLAIAWPEQPRYGQVSDKDQQLPRLRDVAASLAN